MIERFGDPERGGFFSTSDDHEELIARRKEIGDHPIPSGNSSAALGLLRLAALSGERGYERQAEGVLRLFAGPPLSHPEAFAHLLRALDFHLAPTKEVALVGEDLGRAGRASSARACRPHLVLAGGPEGTDAPPLLARPAHGRRPRRPPTSASTSPAGCRSPSRGEHCPTLLLISMRVRNEGLPLHLPRPAAGEVDRLRDLVRRDLHRAQARPSCRESSKTPKATRRPPTCPAAPNRPRRWTPPSRCRTAKSRPR